MFVKKAHLIQQPKGLPEVPRQDVLQALGVLGRLRERSRPEVVKLNEKNKYMVDICWILGKYLLDICWILGKYLVDIC